MQLEFTHTFAVRAAFAKGDAVHWKVVRLQREATFLERDDTSAPIAFVFRQERERTPYLIRYDRGYDGLYLRHAKVSAIEAKYDAHPRDFLDKKAFVKINALASNGQLPNEGSQLLRRLPDLHSANQDDLREAEADLRDVEANFIVADGWFWRRVPEPTFQVYRTNEGWKTILSFGNTARLGVDRRHFHFGLHQYEEMLDWKTRLSALTGRPSTEDDFEHRGVYEPKVDGYVLDLEYALQDIFKRFSKQSDEARVSADDRFEFLRLPMPVLDVLYKARRLLDMPGEERSEQTYADIVELLESIPEVLEAHPQYQDVFAKPSEIALQIEKWQARPISLLPAFNAPSP